MKRRMLLLTFRPWLNFRSYSFIFSAIFVVFLCCSCQYAKAAANVFPEYASLQKNITFWENIYSTHSVNSAVIHDRDDLSKVYDIIHLLDPGLPDADRINSTAIKQSIQHYQTILLELGNGKKPLTTAENKVFAMFTGADSRKLMLKSADNIRSQTGQKERFREGVGRSGAYMAEIRKIFTAKGLPSDLAYLPHVESSFQNKAYSKFGAAGMWQFTRSTGKQYLTINDAVDERRDPLLAAEAAAKYLKNSYKLLGSWPLALTAYNYGTAGMLRAQKAKGSYVKIHAEYKEGHFGFASRNFYSEFIAAMRVAKKLEKDKSIGMATPHSFRVFVLPGYIHINDIKRHFNLSLATIKALNPALRDTVFDGKRLITRGYPLRLPTDSKTKQRIATVKKSYFSNSQLQDSSYRVKSGDTASAIAARHGITLKTLIHANHLDSNAKIFIGQKLRIPTASSSAKDPTLKYIPIGEQKIFSSNRHSDSGAKSNIPTFAAKSKNKPAVTPVAAGGQQYDRIIIHPEESLPLLAMWLQIPESELRKANRLSATDIIEPGQEITIIHKNVSAAEFADLRNDFAMETEEDFFATYAIVSEKTYLVQPGDNLWELCNDKFGIPLWLLKKYNSDIDIRRIHPKQELIIPVLRKL